MAPGADDEPIGRRESDATMAVIVFRLSEVEKAVAQLGTKIDNLRFVHRDVYNANQETALQIHETLANKIKDAKVDLKEDIEDARKLSVWALCTIGAALLGLIIAGIGRLAGLG